MTRRISTHPSRASINESGAPQTLVVDFLAPSQWVATPEQVQAICSETGVVLLREVKADEARWVCQVPGGVALPICSTSGRVTLPAEAE